MSDGGQLTARGRAATRSAPRPAVPMITCPYCRQTFGPWCAAAIEPCRMCERPLHRSLGWARPRRVVLLLETVNALQGIGVMVAGIAFVTGAITLPAGGSCLWSSLDRGYWPQVTGRVFGKKAPPRRQRLPSHQTGVCWKGPAWVHGLGGVTGISALARNFLWAKCDD